MLQSPALPGFTLGALMGTLQSDIERGWKWLCHLHAFLDAEGSPALLAGGLLLLAKPKLSSWACVSMAVCLAVVPWSG